MKNKLNQPIEEKCPGTCTQCGGAETMWHVSETCGIGKAWANFNKKIEAGEIPDITKCPMNPMEMSNQPIEEKWNWQEEFDEKFDIGPLFEKENGIRARAIYGGKEIKSFIENLLEQERRRMGDEIQRIEERLSDSERWPIGERKRMQNTIKKVLSIINK